MMTAELACLEELRLDDRVVADPSIAIADLEKALDDYFQELQYRDIEGALELIKSHKVSWKTSPKAMAWDLV